MLGDIGEVRLIVVLNADKQQIFCIRNYPLGVVFCYNTSFFSF